MTVENPPAGWHTGAVSEIWIGFDADDTLWHNEHYFVESYALFAELVAPYLQDEHDDPEAAAHDLLIATERRNIPSFGYGIKGATISMIEAAITASHGEIGQEHILRLVDRAKTMMQHPIEFLDGALDTIDALSRHNLVLLTKGDLKDQHRKIEMSNIAERFDAVEIMHEKDETTYRKAFERFEIEPSRFVMIGNSVKSDIIPVLGLGSGAVHVPYRTTWAIEIAEEPTEHPRYRQADSMHAVPPIVDELLG